MNTSNNTVFITGSTAGIGLEIAKIFWENGNKVIINGRNEERLGHVLQQLPGATGLQGDLSQEEDRLRIAEKIKREYPGINVIVNNAGAAYAYSLANEDDAYRWARDEIQTNYLSIIHFNELLLPTLKNQSEAAIVNVTSIVGMVPQKNLPTYSASKAALRAYTNVLRSSLESSSVKVFELIPPLVNTAFSASIGGERGIPPSEVAEELWKAFQDDRFEVPVGMSKYVHAVMADGLNKINGAG